MTKCVKVGNLWVGGGNPITVQTMTNVKTENIPLLLNQVNQLTECGADIIRITVNNDFAVEGFKQACKVKKLPLVADIHYDYRLAIKSVEAGADKIRINPGNMTDLGVKKLCEVLRSTLTPVRVGVNSGSLPKDLLERYGNTPKAIVESAIRNVHLLEDEGIENIIISVKSSDTQKTIESYKLLSTMCDYPLHLGVTEAGGGDMAVIKSSIGIGSLLSLGVGDTIRVSLSDDPQKEVIVGKQILNALGINKNFVDIISCPTCGRTEYDVIGTSKRLRQQLANLNYPLKIAVMGCVVNGLGEGKEADFGIAGSKDKSIIFVKGEPLITVENDIAEKYLIDLINQHIENINCNN